MTGIARTASLKRMNERTFKPGEAHKLEDPERLKWLPPGEVIEKLNVKPGTRIADIGAGTGYFAIPLALAAGASGRVYAVDLQREMLDLLRAKLKSAKVPRNIELRQGSAVSTSLAPDCCDLVFIANVWHELDAHEDVLAEAARVLSPGGAVAILDWRTDVGRPPGPPLEHRIDAAAVRETLTRNGWTVTACEHVGQYSYLLIGRVTSNPGPA